METGGPAFPKPHDPYPNVQNCTSMSGAAGMTLRDYFAGQAMASIPVRSWEHIGDEEKIVAAWAKCAYAVADAMLEVRKS